jgi:hypothetical protein
MKQFEYVCAYAKIPSLSILSSSSRNNENLYIEGKKKRGNLLLKGNGLKVAKGKRKEITYTHLLAI